MGKEEKAIEKKQEQALEQIPSYLRAPDGGGDNRGFEEVGQKDIKIPMLRICQSMSPYRQKSDPKYVQDLEEGQYFNTITKQNYGSKILVVPLMMFHTRLRFGKDGQGLLCRAMTGLIGVGDPGGDCAKCSMSQWLTTPRADGSRRPECDQYKNYACVVVGKDRILHPEDTCIFPMKGTAIPVSDTWIALARLRGRGLPLWGGVYQLTTVQMPPKKAGQGPYYVPFVDNAGFIPESTVKSAEEAFTAFVEVRNSQKFQDQLLKDLEEVSRESGDDTGTGGM